MRRLLVAILLMAGWSSLVQAQQVSLPPDCVVPFSFTAAGSTPAFDDRGAGCTIWELRYQSSGFSAISIQFDQAPDANGVAGSWVIWPTLYSGSLPLTDAAFSSIDGYGYAPWVRVTLNSKTGTTGRTYGNLVGWRAASVGVDSRTGGLPVTATIGTATINTATLATSSNQTSGAQKTQIVDAGGAVLTTSAAGATRPADVIIRDTSGNAITTFGITGAVVLGTGTNSVGTVNVGNVPHVIVDSGGGSNASVSATGSAVPASATYVMGDVAGTGRGLTATNTAGSTYALDVNIVAGGGTGGTASTVGAATPATATAIGGNDGTDMQIPMVADVDTSGATHYTLETVLVNPGNPASLVTFAADAANQTAVASAPLPNGVVYKSGGNALADGQVGYMAADNQSHPIIAGCGTAGTPACGVVTVQGVTSMTPIAISGTVNVGTVSAIGGTVTVTNLTPSLFETITLGSLASNGAAAGSNAIASIPGIATFAQPSYTEGRAVAISLTTNGAGRIVLMDPVNDRSAKVDSNGNLQVISPGITYNTTPSTLTNGQVGDFQITEDQSLITAEQAGLPVRVVGLTATVQTIVGTAAVLTTLDCANEDTAWAYVQVFDNASPSLGSTASFPLPLPPGGGNLGPMRPMKFANAIKVAATTDATGSTGAGAGKVNCWAGYRTP